MIWVDQPYVTLMASLPAIRFLTEKEPPINRQRLMERLKDLPPADQETLRELTEVVSWRFVDTTQDDAAFLARAAALLERIASPTLAAAVRQRLELRTVIAALRRRHAGEDAPPKGVRWGFGPHLERIRASWSLPDLGVAAFYPWLPAAKEALDAGDTVALERLLLETAWQQQARHAEGHEFDFEAVALYMLRWSMADRWARYDADEARRRFAELLDAALADAPEIPEAA
ncbi:MAG: hypothetical protein H6852_09985 [Geminicoccaceae bacterium]|jgi:hypothetical protein|nr:hypothetical protein [Geminicoccaceae bacterium]MCB9967946.1 hypothetical protein [Geminicoccaceae bacterium]HRY24975.1 hypothetical protein [Geminicoccaceae bacterium]